jgi:WXG100 family type VII secretion target
VTVQYNFADLAELSGAIGKAHAGVESLKGDINSSSNQLRAEWSGSATESWTTVQTKWTNQCDALLTALHQLSLTVQSNADDMALTEARNAGLFQNM